MSYELKKPVTIQEQTDFILRYGRQMGLKIEKTDQFIFALEPNEIMGTKEIDGQIIAYPVINQNYEQELTDARQQDFKSKFFEIKNFGWYRKEPKGYSSAVESINSAYNSFTEMQKLGLTENFPANTLIFYRQPDFTKPEQCTEEWLVAHQILNQEMTPQQFGQFYIGFIQAWNTQEHEQSEAE